MAAVTVRALHHYDRLALLRPRRSGSGYRLYTLQDLERLERPHRPASVSMACVAMAPRARR